LISPFDTLKQQFIKNLERERHLEPRVETLSRKLWPYPISKLVFYITILAVLDFVSTFTALELSGCSHVYEAGPIAKWALQTGGFPVLFIVDTICISTLISLAFGARFFYERLGLKGFGRAAQVLLLCPYLVVIMGVILNNVLITLMS
jgi:hypothetical protein